MTDCKECGKILGLLEGYRHPIYGKSHLLCSICFDTVYESVRKWGEFVVSNSFNKTSPSSDLKINLKKINSIFTRKHENIHNYVKIPIIEKTQM